MSGWTQAAALFFTFLGFFGNPLSTRSAERVVAQFSVATDGDLLCLPVSVAGHTYSFVLDTGCDGMVYDSTLRKHLGDPVGTAKLNGDRLIETFRSVPARLGPIDLQTREPVCCIDLTRVREATGYDVKGIIGMSALSTLAFRVDFDKGRLIVLSDVNPESGEAIRLYFRSPNKPTVLAALPAVGLTQICIDTGMNGSLCLMHRMFADLRKSGHIARKKETIGLTVDKVESRIKGTLQNMTLSRFDLEGLSVHSARRNAIGLAYLSRFVVTFDFPNKTLYLRPGKHFGRPEWHNLSGLMMIRRAGRTIIFNVECGSVAEAVGLQRNDIVVSINGRDATEYSLFQIRQLMGRGGTQVSFVLEREGRRSKRSITLSSE